MINQLLPCPFCGGEPAPFWNGVGCVTAKCAMDGLHISTEAWNRRAIQPPAGEPVAWMTRPRIGSHKGREFICEPDASLNLDQWEKPFPVYAAPPAAAPVADGEPVAFSTEHGALFWHGSPQDWKGKPVQLYLAPPAAAHGDEAMRKDAGRYRWLRACGDEWGSLRFLDSRGDVDAEALDEAIDAAMRAQGDGEVQ